MGLMYAVANSRLMHEHSLGNSYTVAQALKTTLRSHPRRPHIPTNVYGEILKKSFLTQSILHMPSQPSIIQSYGNCLRRTWFSAVMRCNSRKRASRFRLLGATKLRLRFIQTICQQVVEAQVSWRLVPFETHVIETKNENFNA